MKRNQSNYKRSLIILGIVAVVGLIVYYVIVNPQRQYYESHHVKIHGTYLLRPITIEHFELIDHHGKSFTQHNLNNHWTMLFFGFTQCNMICPTTLSALNQMYYLLQKILPPQSLPQIVFITIDPQRDTIERLNNYITSFNTQFIGLRPSIEKVTALEKKFHIPATQRQWEEAPNNTQYSINHSAEIILVNPEAHVQAYFSYPHNPQQMAKEYYDIIKLYTKNKRVPFSKSTQKGQ